MHSMHATFRDDFVRALPAFLFRDSGGFSSKMTPQDEQSLFRRTSDMFFYLRTPWSLFDDRIF